MTRLPIRGRLTAAFAAALVLVLVLTGLFVFVRVRANIDEAVDARLGVRADAVAARARATTGAPQATVDAAAGEPEEGFAQMLARDGRVLARAGRARAPVLRPTEVARADRGSLTVERRVPGVGGRTRILARPLRAASAAGDATPAIVVVGQSLEDRDEALTGLAVALALGAAAAVALASLVGWALATAGLAPIEAMRRRAEHLSLSDSDARLPLPPARDEVYRLGTTLNDMLDRLRRSFERERRFVAEASHELRTPLAVQRTELEAALRSPGLPAEARRSLVVALEECDHLAQLADDLLVITQGSEGGLDLRVEDVDARHLLEGVRDRFADRAAEQRREVRVEAPGDLVVRCDPLRMRQALGNLVENALRHGDGTVIVRGRALPDGGVELEVADEGPGLRPELVEHAFERFTRGQDARTTRGAGLGLAIVRTIAEAHGGSAALVGPRGPAVRLVLPGAAGGPAGRGPGSETLPAGPSQDHAVA